MNAALAEGELVQQADPSAGPPLQRGELIYVWVFWAFIAMLMTLNADINDLLTTSARLPFSVPLIAAVFDALVWAALTPLIFRLTRRWSLDRPGWLWRVLQLIALGLVISLCQTEFIQWVRYREVLYFAPRLIGPQPPLFSPGFVLHRFWFVSEFFVYLLIMAAGYAHDNFMRYLARHRQTIALRTELADARLSALRAQLNPHFFFNTLNTISSLIDNRPHDAQRIIAKLAELLRETLEPSAAEVSLAQELRFLRRYLEIMQARFEQRLEIREHIEPGTLDAVVPNLILQPLVENAIKHGLENVHAAGRIEIHAQRRGDSLLLRVIDNGRACPAGAAQCGAEGGLGLRNTRARLLQAYGQRQSLSLRNDDGGGVSAEITLPFQLKTTTEVAA